MSAGKITGIVCILIGIFAPIYIAVKKPQQFRSRWFIVFLIADVLWMFFLGIQFMTGRENF